MGTPDHVSLTEAPPPALPSAVGELRALAADDWRLDQALSRDPDVVRWTLHPADLGEEAARARVGRSRANAAAGRGRRYAIVLDGQAVGLAGIAAADDGDPEVFYALLPAGRRQGAATAAARALADWALNAGARRVLLLTIPGNTASEAVARRAGFAETGTEVRPHRGVPTEMTVWDTTR
jgi:RimJ/RimL family protein N-acetyltransferase